MSVIFPFPALHPETLDYTDPQGYRSEVQRASNKITVHHSIDRNNLVYRLIHEKMAVFCATVSVRGSIYRRTEDVPLDRAVDSQGDIFCRQVIEIPEFKDDLQIFINCGVATCREIKMEQGQEECFEFRSPDSSQNSPVVLLHKDTGLSDFFLDSEIRFPENSLIAYSGWNRFFSLDSLFTIVSDPKIIRYGEFSAHITYANQLKIYIDMAPSLYDEINGNRNSPARGHVICAGLVKALEELHSAYLRTEEQGEGANDTDRQLLEQAEGLKHYLESRSPPIPTWEDENFNAVYAASSYRPAPCPVTETEESP